MKKTGGNGLYSQSVSGIYDNESCVIMRLNLFFLFFVFFCFLMDSGVFEVIIEFIKSYH